MPIYAYKCESCGHRLDVLQKISEAPLDTCPACGARSFAKQVTSAGFQLKGSGWYVTDFRSSGKPAEGKPAEAPAEGASKAAAEPASAPAPAPAVATADSKKASAGATDPS